MKMIVMRLARVRAAAFAAAGAAAAVAILVACGGPAQTAGSTAGDSAGDSAGNGRLRVLAAFYPYYFLAEQVGGGEVAVGNLTQSGVEPHDLELTPRQVADIGTADVVVYQKGFQPAVDEAIAHNRPKNVLDVSTVLPRNTEADPHLWLDPNRFAKVATAVGESLAAADSAHAAAYRARAESLTARLRTLDQDFVTGLKNCKSRAIVTSHAAFGYLAARYDLKQIPISGLAPDAEPSPARIKAVGDAVRQHGVTTIFFETLVSPKAAQTLAADLGVGTAVLDPVEGLADPTTGDYFSVMRANLATLHKALSCA
jgi:zinc transport system substrate-binding protein